MIKLARFNEGMRKIISQTLHSIKAIGSFSTILILFIFVWSLMGMELFAYVCIQDLDGNLLSQDEAMALIEAGFEDQIVYPRIHFNDVFQAHISVYSLINGEDWHEIMFILVRGFDAQGKKTWIPKVYCVVGIIFGNFTLLALFTGSLLQAFSSTIKEHQNIDQD